MKEIFYKKGGIAMGSGNTSCGSTLDKVFDTGNVVILIVGVLVTLLIASMFYCRGQKGLREKYAVGRETSVISMEEVVGEDGSPQYVVSTRTVNAGKTIEDMQSYDAESAENRNHYIIYFVAGAAFLFFVWFVACLKA